MSAKSVFVHLGEFSPVIQLDSTAHGSEKDVLFSKDSLQLANSGDDRLISQRKDHSWGEIIVDFLDEMSEDRSAVA